MHLRQVFSAITLLGLFLATLATPAVAKDKGDLLVRLRGLNVQPMDDSTDITGLAATNRRIGVASDAFVPELDFTYFWTENIGTELILGTTKNVLKGNGVLGSLGDIGRVRLIPPTLTLQYHFLPKSVISPYLGAGINYTIFFDAQSYASLDNTLGSTDVDLENTFGYALQGGVDIEVYPGWMLNLDIKYIDISPDVTLTSGSGVNNVVRTSEVDINPVVMGIGIGTTFSTDEWF